MKRKDKALSRLQALLANGQYPVGSRLPPERELTSKLNLSRSGLREGLAMLEAQGKIWRGVGRGTYVGFRAPGPAAKLSLIGARTNSTDVLEVRLLIEPLIARLAALRATESDVSELSRILEKSESARDPRTWGLWDGRLHRMVAEATHNSLLLDIFDAFNAVRKQTSWGQLWHASLTPERRENYCRHHRAYVDAIANRNPDRAEAAMRGHIESVRDDMLKAAGLIKTSSRDRLRKGAPTTSRGVT